MRKAYWSIFITLLGIVIEDSPLQEANAPLPIAVTLFGMVTDERLIQFSKT